MKSAEHRRSADFRKSKLSAARFVCTHTYVAQLAQNVIDAHRLSRRHEDFAAIELLAVHILRHNPFVCTPSTARHIEIVFEKCFLAGRALIRCCGPLNRIVHRVFVHQTLHESIESLAIVGQQRCANRFVQTLHAKMEISKRVLNELLHNLHSIRCARTLVARMRIEFVHTNRAPTDSNQLEPVADRQNHIAAT